MKQTILLLFSIVIAHWGYSQVGINTTKPQGIFHIDPDGKTNNANNSSDDIIVSASGDMGIGTVAPQVKLHIVSGGTRIDPKPGFILKDGNEAENRILTTNSDGLATWQPTNAMPSVKGVLNKLSPISLNYNSPAGQYYDTGAYIKLPPGRWIVNVVMILSNPRHFSEPQAFESVWVRSTFADPGKLVASADIELTDPKLISGLGWKNSWGLIQGFIIINNKHEDSRTYNYIIGNVENNGPLQGHFRDFTTWKEDNIVAYRLTN